MIAYFFPLIINLYTERNFSVLSRVYKVQSDIQFLTIKIENYRKITGKLPKTFDDLVNSKFNESKIGVLPKDPWGRIYIYYIKNEGGREKIFIGTYGADGKPGGAGLDADLSSETDWSYLRK